MLNLAKKELVDNFAIKKEIYTKMVEREILRLYPEMEDTLKEKFVLCLNFGFIYKYPSNDTSVLVVLTKENGEQIVLDNIVRNYVNEEKEENKKLIDIAIGCDLKENQYSEVSTCAGEKVSKHGAFVFFDTLEELQKIKKIECIWRDVHNDEENDSLYCYTAFVYYPEFVNETGGNIYEIRSVDNNVMNIRYSKEVAQNIVRKENKEGTTDKFSVFKRMVELTGGAQHGRFTSMMSIAQDFDYISSFYYEMNDRVDFKSMMVYRVEGVETPPLTKAQESFNYMKTFYEKELMDMEHADKRGVIIDRCDKKARITDEAFVLFHIDTEEDMKL